jgi:uncharacterized membrane protein
MRKASFCIILLTVAMFLAGARPATAVPPHVCKDLGTLPFPYNNQSVASGINATGQVAGFSSNNSGGTHAFL